MTPESAKKELAKRISQSGIEMPQLTLAQGIRLMIEFYQDARADGCEFDQDGDMLLFQWGTYNWGDGPSFQCDITRQFIVSDAENDAEDDDPVISQLSLRFHFPPSAQFDAIKSSNEWCQTPHDLAAFEAFITENDAYRAVQDSRPSKVVLRYGRV